MSDAMIDKLSHVDLATVVVIILFAIVVSSALQPLFTKLYKAIIKKYKKEQKEESMEKALENNCKRMKEYEQNRVNDRAQSFKIQKELTDAISKLTQELASLKKTTEERYQQSLERENKRARAELKDRIGESYRFFHTTKRWNSMEKEALEDLIQEYEDAGGKNSFVHSVVQEEMYTWELIDHNASVNR